MLIGQALAGSWPGQRQIPAAGAYLQHGHLAARPGRACRACGAPFAAWNNRDAVALAQLFTIDPYRTGSETRPPATSTSTGPQAGLPAKMISQIPPKPHRNLMQRAGSAPIKMALNWPDRSSRMVSEVFTFGLDLGVWGLIGRVLTG
jgi:hypothetical protein